MTTFAYIRVSTNTKKQTTDNQRKAILDAGFAVDKFISEDGVSGSIKALQRPAFSKMMREAVSGDTVIVTMVDRLGRNAGDILNTVEEFKRLGIRLRVLQFDGVDITSSMGKMLVTLMSAFAELEKNTIVERINAGLARTKEQGTILGRSFTITPDTLEKLVKGKAAGKTLDVLSEEFSLPKSTISRNINKCGNDLNGYRERYNKQQAQ